MVSRFVGGVWGRREGRAGGMDRKERMDIVDGQNGLYIQTKREYTVLCTYQ